ncbi:BMP family lipoprotein [Oceanirhabdus seepicola]|uniref:BMP family ABC transporter substrate-binding protein n=1 Tax=Oceanirhabdus seepicola TaxID=2828781 RepID=A0A9J6P2I6_9CLOT|nr:BMP family ABC transporter substrate-binding protein [Oceanirhabdus seepicola]MCM1990414.1 BMP family ABC transporter substrate-binding protein [Oceanirhabdus seepicola]
MFNKKLVAMTLAITMVAAGFVGCGKKNTENNAANNNAKNNTKVEEKGEEIKVGLATDEGGVNDKSFNQSADEGIHRAGETLNVKYNYIESQSKEDYAENLEALIDDGKDVVFAVGFQMADAVSGMSEKYADAKIAIIDNAYEVQPANVHSIVFKEHEGSFLVGVIAGLTTKTNNIGFIGGKDFPLINRFEFGFAAGVMSVNPEAGKDLVSRDAVKYADSFGDVNKGYELAKALYDEGCDIIYHAAGGVGIGLFKATAELREAGKDVWAIGVDMDQAVSLPEYKDVILTSMIKRVDTATFSVVNDVANGEFKGGQVTALGLKEEGVGIAASSKEHVSEEILAKVEETKKAIIEGEIVVPENVEQLKEFK